MTIEFAVLGSTEATVDGRPVPLGHVRQRTVLAVLLVEADRPVSTDQLIDRVWGDRVPRQARATLHGYVSRLRQVLAATGQARITRRSGGYVLTTGDVTRVDLHRFRGLVGRARAGGEAGGAAELYEQALRLWRGAAFDGMDTPWINALRDVLDQERFAAELDLGDLRLDLGQHAAVLPELSARAVAHPLDERVAGQVMLALRRCGRPADALAHYRRFEQRMIHELGIGPGQALRDAQAVILRQDTPAAPRTPVSPAQLPPGVPAFVGRAGELARLDASLPEGGGPALPPAVVISALSGTAGVGKTTLAVHWARRVRGRFPDGQLYVNLRGFDPGGPAMDPAEAVRGFLDGLGVPPSRVPPGLDAQIGLYRSLLADRRMLVLLDNARDAEQVRPLLPGAPGSLALVTSRSRITSLAAVEGAELLLVDLLSADESRDLLIGRLGAERVAAEPAAVREIVARCAGLPLALAIAAARAKAQPRLPIAALADELGQADGRLDALDGGDPAAQVRAVFSWSYRALSPDAARLFRLLGLHPGPDAALPAIAALAGTPVPPTRAALAELTGLHLVTEHVAGRYGFHDLIRAYAAELTTDDHDVRHTAMLRMLDHYLHTAYAADALLTRKRELITVSAAQPGAAPQRPENHRQALAWFTAEHPVLLALVERARAAGFPAHSWQLAAALTTFLELQVHWPALAAAQTTALDTARHLLDRTGQANAHRGLGLARDRLGHADDARTHYLLALRLFGEVGNNAGRARTHQHLARLAGAQGHHREALEHAEASLGHYRAADDRGGQSAALNHLGWFHAQLGEYHRALTHCEQALALAQETDDLSGQAHTWDSLGYVHRHLGQYAEAVTCYRHALELFRVTGDRHSEATGLAYLGDAHHNAGEPVAARDAWDRALAVFEEIGHPDADALRARIPPGRVG